MSRAVGWNLVPLFTSVLYTLNSHLAKSHVFLSDDHSTSSETIRNNSLWTKMKNRKVGKREWSSLWDFSSLFSVSYFIISSSLPRHWWSSPKWNHSRYLCPKPSSKICQWKHSLLLMIHGMVLWIEMVFLSFEEFAKGLQTNSTTKH